MKKNRISIKAVISLILSLVLLCMPIGAFSLNGIYALSVRAEGTAETEENTENKETESTETGNGTDFGKMKQKQKRKPCREMKSWSRCASVRKNAAHMNMTMTAGYARKIINAAPIKNQM